jgi:hypothetical protein
MPVIIPLLIFVHKEGRGTTTIKRNSLVWCSDDGFVRYCHALYDTSSSYSLRENQSNRNRAVTGSMIDLRDLLIINLTLQVFDGLFSLSSIFTRRGRR